MTFSPPPMRRLPYPVDNSASNSSDITGEPECDGSPAVVFPDDPDELTLVPFFISLNEYNMLASCVDVGADIAYSTDAQRVLYVWLRNMRCADMICDFIKNCTLEALGLAFGASQYAEIQAIAAAQQEQYAADYTGTPASINPDTFDTNFDGSGTPEDTQVLCSAAEAFVKMFAAQKAQQLKLTFGAAAAMLALITLLVPGLGWILAAGIYIAIGAATLITGVTYGAAITALEDGQALVNVGCCLKTSLAGNAVTEANWNGIALTGCDFAAASNEEIVQGFVVEALAENYLTFLDLIGTAKNAQDNGQPVECGCETNMDWEHRFDFTIDEQGWQAHAPYGAYIAATGWQDINGVLLWLYREFSPDNAITGVRFEITGTGCTYFQVYSPEPELTYGDTFIAASTNDYTADTTGITGFDAISDIVCRPSVSGITPATTIVTAITLYGTGAEPVW